MASEKIERYLYGGKVHILHDPHAKGSSPRYKVMNGTTIVEKPKGATTIQGAVLGKDLMDWAVSCCVSELREKLPSITEADLVEAAKAYTRKRDAGANTGTEAHAMVEQFLKSKDGTDTVFVPVGSVEAQLAFRAFEQWFNEAKPTVVGVEEIVYSREFKYAGAYDCMLEIDGKVYLCDFKTTNSSRKAPNGVYAEYFTQLGAYAGAYEEERAVSKNGPKIDGLMVISGKKTGKLDIVTNQDVGLSVDDCIQMFRKICNLYAFLTYVTKELGGK